jgi:hypothetical protein
MTDSTIYLVDKERLDTLKNTVQKILYEQLRNAIPSNFNYICNQILRNAIVLVHMYKFIENGERYSKSDINWEKPFNINTNEIHPLGYTGFGCDDFLLAEKRNIPLLTLFTRQCFRKGTSNDYVIDKYFLLLNNIPHGNTELLKTSKQSTSYLEFASDNSYVILHLGKTNKGGGKLTRNTKIFSPLIYLTEGGHSLPCWDEEQWRLFGLTPTGEMRIALSTTKAPL